MLRIEGKYGDCDINTGGRREDTGRRMDSYSRACTYLENQAQAHTHTYDQPTQARPRMQCSGCTSLSTSWKTAGQTQGDPRASQLGTVERERGDRQRESGNTHSMKRAEDSNGEGKFGFINARCDQWKAVGVFRTKRSIDRNIAVRPMHLIG